MFRGLKFANPEIVLGQKDFYRRDKDVRDVERAAVLLTAGDSPSFDPSFEFASRCETLLRELTDSKPANPSRRVDGPLRRLFKRILAYGHSLIKAGPDLGSKVPRG
jgi:hypothetical protein